MQVDREVEGEILGEVIAEIDAVEIRKEGEDFEGSHGASIEHLRLSCADFAQYQCLHLSTKFQEELISILKCRV